MSNENEKAPEAAQSMELVVVQTAITSMNRLTEGLADLSKKFKGVVYDVTTPKGMAEAKAARKEIAEPRIQVEKIREAAKQPILEMGRRLDAEAKRIKQELLNLEEPIKAQIEAEEQRVENERLEKVRREERRIADIEGRIASMRHIVHAALRAQSSAEVERILAALQGVAVDAELFAEYLDAAKVAKAEGIAEIEKIRDQVVAREAEAEKLRKDREELDRLRAEQAERDRVARENEAKERERKAVIERRLNWLRGNQTFTATSSTTLIQQNIEEIKQAPITEELYQEFLTEAQEIRDAALARLNGIYIAAHEHKREQEKLAQQREAQAAEQRRLDAQREEQERREREAREAEEARQRQEQEAREKREREEAAARAEQERLNWEPGPDSCIHVLSTTYQRDAATVEGWLRKYFGAKKAQRAA